MTKKQKEEEEIRRRNNFGWCKIEVFLKNGQLLLNLVDFLTNTV